MTDLETTAVDDVVIACTERLDTELLAAYRAGYAYLFVGHKLPSLSGNVFTAPKLAVFPSHTDVRVEALPDGYWWTRYDLDGSIIYAAANKGPRVDGPGRS